MSFAGGVYCCCLTVAAGGGAGVDHHAPALGTKDRQRLLDRQIDRRHAALTDLLLYPVPWYFHNSSLHRSFAFSGAGVKWARNLSRSLENGKSCRGCDDAEDQQRKQCHLNHRGATPNLDLCGSWNWRRIAHHRKETDPFARRQSLT